MSALSFTHPIIALELNKSMSSLIWKKWDPVWHKEGIQYIIGSLHWYKLLSVCTGLYFITRSYYATTAKAPEKYTVFAVFLLCCIYNVYNTLVHTLHIKSLSGI